MTCRQVRILPLHMLERSNRRQMHELFKLLRKNGQAQTISNRHQSESNLYLQTGAAKTPIYLHYLHLTRMGRCLTVDKNVST